MPFRLILGNEAVAQGAIDAGIIADGPWAKNGGGSNGRVSGAQDSPDKRTSVERSRPRLREIASAPAWKG